MMKRRVILLCIFLFLVSFFLRVGFMNAGLFHHDSVQLARTMENTAESFVPHEAVGGRVGVVLIYTIPYLLYNNAYMVATLLTILFASLSICVLFFLVHELFDNIFLSFSSSLLFSMSPLYLSVTTYAKSHAIAIFFVLLSFYFLTRNIKTGKWCWGFAASMTFILSLFMRADNILYLPIMAMLFIFPVWVINGKHIAYDVGTRFSARNLIAIFGPLFLIFILNLIYTFFYKYSHLDKFVLDFGAAGTLIFFGLIRLEPAMSSFLFRFLILAIVYMLIEKDLNLKFLFLFIWFGCIFIPLTILNVSSSRHFIGALIPLCIIASFGLKMLYDIKRYASVALLIVFLSLSFFAIQPILSYRHAHNSGQDYGLAISDIVEPGSYFMASDYGVFAEYYGNVSTIGFDADLTGKKVYVTDFVLKNHNVSFDVTTVGTIVMEDYHHAELELKVKNETIYLIS